MVSFFATSDFWPSICCLEFCLKLTVCVKTLLKTALVSFCTFASWRDHPTILHGRVSQVIWCFVAPEKSKEPVKIMVDLFILLLYDPSLNYLLLLGLGFHSS